MRRPKSLTSPGSPKPAPAALPAIRQMRLDDLMARNNNGVLTAAEKDELRDLVRQAEKVALANAHALADRRQPGREMN